MKIKFFPSKIPIQTIVKYVRDLSIVVAGIAVTLYASDRISGKSENRDLKLYLNAVKFEVEENIKTLDRNIQRLQPSIAYSNYLISNDRNSLEKDSIEKYGPIIYSFFSPTFKTNAFEMLKSSGMMRLVNNKELLLLLWDVYYELSEVKETFDLMFPIKWEDIKKETSLLFDGKDVKVPMYNFFVMGLPNDMAGPCEVALQKSKEVLKMLENELNRYK